MRKLLPLHLLGALWLLPSCKNSSEPPLPAPGAGEPTTGVDEIFDKITSSDAVAMEAVESPEAVVDNVPASTEPAKTRYNFDGIAPTISCAQEKAATAGGNDLQVTCIASSGGTAFKVGSEPLQLKWTFSNPSNSSIVPTVAVGGAADAQGSSATFTFPGPNDAGTYYLADTGSYKLEVVYAKDASQSKSIPQQSVKVIGEGCGKADTLSFRFDTRGYRVVEAGQSVRVLSGGDNGKYVLSKNGSLTTPGASSIFFAANTGRVIDKGNDGIAFIFGGSSYTAEGQPKLVLTDKTTTVTAPANKVKTFNSPISLCQ